MKRLLPLVLAAALVLTGCAVTPKPLAAKTAVTQPPASSPSVDAAVTDMGLSLLRELRAQEENSAPLISPLSIALALSMAANGADGDTLAEFENFLGGGTSLEELNAACAAYLEDYQNLGGSTQASIANSVWADPAGQIKDEFVAKCQGIFQAETFQEDLSAPSIVDTLNSWIAEKTNKLIPSMIQTPFDDSVAVLLVNALYLKNRWQTPFSPQATHPRDFNRENGTVDRIDFLQAGSYTLPYCSGEGVQGCVLPYDDGRLGFFALLPEDLDGWFAQADGASLQALLLSAQDTLFLHLALPKFEAEWQGSLTQLFPRLGLELPFAAGAAGFSKLGDRSGGYYISQVIHAAKIEVHEKGTEAAAATVVAASGGAAPAQNGVTLILDRPFVYGICDLETGLPLFLGIYS